MSTSIILFTLDGCSHCSSLKKRLNDLSIPFNEIEINKNPEIWETVVKEIKHEYLPTTFIINRDYDEGLVFIPSIDYETEDEIVEIIKNHT